MAALRQLGEEKAQAFRAGFVGKALSAVTLRGTSKSTPALTANFLKVEMSGSLAANQMVKAQVVRTDEAQLFAVSTDHMP